MKRKVLWRWKRWPTGLLAGVVVISGCSGGGLALQPILPVTLSGNVNGINQVPPVDTLGRGRLSVQVSDAQSPITVTFVNTNPPGLKTPVTAITLQVGAFGENGPTIFTFYTPSQGALPATLTKTLTATDLQPAPQVGINSFSDAINAIRSGNTYLEISTQANPAGEIRGQVGQDRLVSLPGTAQISPPPNTIARAEATVHVNAAQRRITVTIDVMNPQGIANVTGVEIHIGDPVGEGHQAPVLFTLYTPTEGSFPRTLTKTLTEANLQIAPQKGIHNFDDVLEVLPVLGNLPGDQIFINIRTQAFPNGELRGSIFQPNIVQPASGPSLAG